MTMANEYASAALPLSADGMRLFFLLRTSGAIHRALAGIDFEEASSRITISRPYSEMRAVPPLSTRTLCYEVVSPPHVGPKNQGLLLLSSHEPHYTYAGRSTREQHPLTGTNGGSGPFNTSTTTPGATAY